MSKRVERARKRRRLGGLVAAMLFAFLVFLAPSAARGDAEDASSGEPDAASAAAPAAAVARVSPPALTPSQERAAVAEAERAQAQHDADSAHTETERLVARELARLLAVEQAQAAFGASLLEARKTMDARRETTLGWQRRAAEVRLAGSEPAADTTYEGLRQTLRAARDAFSATLGRESAVSSNVPQAGNDPLAELQVDAVARRARDERSQVENEARALGAEERALHAEETAQLGEEIDVLNGERLALLPFLSSARRGAITGFTAAGLDQAISETRQLTLTLRYQRYVVTGWVVSLRHPDRALGRALAGGVLDALEWLLAIAAFFWWRKRSQALLRALHLRARDADRKGRLTRASLTSRALGFASQVNRPAEWLILIFVLNWLLPATVATILEVRIVLSVLSWTCGAAFIVDTINALATSDKARASRLPDVDTSSLRLRSLRLVARTVVGFALVLVLSSMVVGRGTIYHWVFSTCWLAALPIALLLVRWWREVVFRRTEVVRKKSSFQLWVLSHRVGWKSFLAATAGGVHLFAVGSVRASRTWVSRFDLTRRLLAYLFRRELTKLGPGRALQATTPLAGDLFTALGPETRSRAWVETDVDAPLARYVLRAGQIAGGTLAIVGERGMGKTSALRRIFEQQIEGADADAAYLLDAGTRGLAGLRASLARRMGLSSDLSFEELATELEARGRVRAVLVDDVQHFVQPVIGGLAAFDEILAVATRHSTTLRWIFAFDAVIWPFLERARDTRPSFDEVLRLAPWREEDIVSLLRARTAQADVSPSFERLLDRLPADADEVDIEEATEHRAGDYYRLLWDYAYGNPGVALHMWRRSLGADETGSPFVGLFTALDISDFESLPDRSVFVLRAVLQLCPATPEQIARATMLGPADVADALRYGLARGYLERDDAGYRVTWTWFRAMTVFLQRRHLLVLR